MASSNIPKLQDSVICSVCMEQYDAHTRKPTILPCQHTFCLCCLKALPASVNGITCPVCRSSVPSSMFITNRAMLEIIEVLQNSTYDTVQQGATDATENPLKCSKHDNTECVLICMECLDGLCLKCVTKNFHKGHQLEETADAKTLLRPRFEAKIQEEQTKVERKLAMVNGSPYSVTEITKAESDFKSIYEKVNYAITKWKAEQQSLLGFYKEEAVRREDKIEMRRGKLLCLAKKEDIDIGTLIEWVKGSKDSKAVEDFTIPTEQFNNAEACETFMAEIRTILQSQEDVTSKLLKGQARQDILSEDSSAGTSRFDAILPKVMEYEQDTEIQDGVTASTSQTQTSESQTQEKFHIVKIVHAYTTNTLICRISSDIILYTNITGSCSILAHDSKQRKHAEKSLKNWPDVISKPQYQYAIKYIKSWYSKQ